MNKEFLLTIGYSTLANRIGNIKPPELEVAHKILISIQNPENLTFAEPAGFSFESVTSSERGVAKSRNTVIEKSSTEYLLFGDDEVTFDSEGIEKVLDYFAHHPECDLVLSRTMDTNGVLRKNYPNKSVKLSRFNSAKAATYEMMIRVPSIKEKNVQLDENFGAGVKNYLGDEYIFISDLIKNGGTAVFLPITTAIHPVDSSGSSWGSSADLRARAVVFTRVFGFWAPLVRAAFILKNYKKTSGVISIFRFIIGR